MAVDKGDFASRETGTTVEAGGFKDGRTKASAVGTEMSGVSLGRIAARKVSATSVGSARGYIEIEFAVACQDVDDVALGNAECPDDARGDVDFPSEGKGDVDAAAATEKAVEFYHHAIGI